MSGTVLTKTYPSLSVDEQEVWRYAACREADEITQALLHTCMAQAASAIVSRVCYARYPLTVTEDGCVFGGVKWRSTALATRLADCREAVLFAATLGAGFDRLLHKYSRLSPARALLLQAYGTACAEALCDAFCAEYPTATARFSPGYGDWDLAAQREVFRLLQPSRHIGVSLNDSLLMTPVKTVTAVIGLGG
ncbi:MAG: Vitamin B12 dependent methionine synthase activation subunit [Ruminococcaceae bacterium]|nr:Vitamin B12 dependent methionine synthase activation subunit [Oscillospiraceae bacterium]